MALDMILLPQVGAFLFVFAIVLGLLTTAKIFENKRVNAAIAIVFGLFSAIYEPFVSGIQAYLPLAAAILVVIFFFVLVKRLFGEKKEGQKYDAVPLSVALMALLLVLISQWNLLKNFLPAGIDATNFGWGLGIVLVLMILWIVYKHNQPQ